ncbi:MAG: RIP metalloprotease RseP [Candidatus Zixiibacteriota bacterium]
MTTLLATIFVLGILIFFHELGHFLVAKKSGIRVERFSLGFPPKLIGKKIGDTEYCVSWIPLGGYVKMAGEDPDEKKINGEPWEFMSKPVHTRAFVVFAGPAMNFILAILIFWGIIFFAGKQEIHENTNQIGLVAPGGPADKTGIKPGDRIISINGIEVSTFKEMAEIIYRQVEKPVEVKWRREGEEYTATIITFKDRILDEKGEIRYVGKIGIGPSYTTIKVGFFRSLLEGIDTSLFILVETIKFIVGLITGTASIKLIGGPVFIAQVAGQTAKTGIVNLLSFTALLSVNLSLINVLPIPVLDGGHLLFLGIEKIKGKPLSIKQRTALQHIGLAFLILLIIFITYNDFVRLIK